MVYRGKGIRTLGIIQMIIGALMGVLGIASIAAVPHWSSYIACGLWVGVWVFLTGLFGYLGARSDTSGNNCLIGVMMGFAITGCIIVGIMVIIYSIAVSQISDYLRCKSGAYRYSYNHYYNDCNYYWSGHNLRNISQAKGGIALGSLLLILAITEFFVALASSIYACNACCCGTPPNPGQVQVAGTQVAYIGPQHGNVVIVPAGGYYGNPAATIQTVSTYTAGQQVQAMQPGAPVYPQQQYNIPQGQVYNQPPPPHQAFQAQSNPAEMEKPPPYNYGQ